MLELSLWIQWGRLLRSVQKTRRCKIDVTVSLLIAQAPSSQPLSLLIIWSLFSCPCALSVYYSLHEVNVSSTWIMTSSSIWCVSVIRSGVKSFKGSVWSRFTYILWPNHSLSNQRCSWSPVINLETTRSLIFVVVKKFTAIFPLRICKDEMLSLKYGNM